MLGATTGSLDSTLHDESNGNINFATNDNQTHYLFAPDLSPSLFTATSKSASASASPTAPSATVDTTIP